MLKNNEVINLNQVFLNCHMLVNLLKTYCFDFFPFTFFVKFREAIYIFLEMCNSIYSSIQATRFKI